MRLHHVQVICPPDAADSAIRRFYADGLGLTEVPKPEPLLGKGGLWFRAFGPGGEVTAEIHVSPNDPFAPARRAHPALLLDGAADLDPLADRLVSLGFDVDLTERDTFPGYQRLHTADAHGNRVEVLAPLR